MTTRTTKVKKISWPFRFLVCLYIGLFSVVSFRLYTRIGVFGCGDECINYTAGYFILLGKSLYSQIFFNHQPALAFLSAFIQWVSQPIDLYHLVLYHRVFIVFYSLCMGALLLWRFRLSAVLFLLLYEGTKYYMYGYQFIGEALIVYPLVYLIGVLWESYEEKKISRTDIYLSALLCSFVIWTREPYIPVAVALGILLFWREKTNRYARWAGTMVVFLMLVPFVIIPLGDYVYQVIVINVPAASSVVGGGNSFSSILYSLFYPVLLFFHGKWSYLRIIELGLATFFWFGISIWSRELKNYASIGIVFVILALAGLRTVEPGTMYFEAFHMLPWYALFIMITVLIVTSVKEKKIQHTLVVAFSVFACWALISPQSFIWENVDTQGEFASQYAKYTQYSQAIQIVTKPSQTLFLDVWDDIIYWEAKRTSSYPLSIYIPVESAIPKYREMRDAMFLQAPPDAYYNCPVAQTLNNSPPQVVTQDYVQLLSTGKPGCLYIKKAIVRELAPDQWRQLQELGFALP